MQYIENRPLFSGPYMSWILARTAGTSASRTAHEMGRELLCLRYVVIGDEAGFPGQFILDLHPGLAFGQYDEFITGLQSTDRFRGLVMLAALSSVLPLGRTLFHTSRKKRVLIF